MQHESIGPVDASVGEPVKIGGLRFSRTETPGQAVDLILSLTSRPKTAGIHVHLANAYTIALADKDTRYAGVFEGRCVIFADGKPLTWVSRLRRHSPPLKQVPGPWLFEEVMRAGGSAGLRHFLLGSTPQVLQSLERNLTRRFPEVRVVGRNSPPFRALSDEELESQASEIKESRPDIVWIGLGTPKQDYEAERIARLHNVVVIAVGAAFDFSAGTLRRAPSWMTAVGLEWLFRLMMEPKRLWRRYLFGNARFLRAVLREAK
ncbi:WecB/TagA/CpsF family glycosyltransferase [Arthrobacter sp. JZ12]|uniref:WecB/TagA/CpsF family glycosyltransferase n=1 Tax=Arthrobacter sp. JZ12 TaxID=2654190 RepID=UPI002B4748A5|nr:WecB/TagA/CpsF family glycosyltransferase [Arthrobacter sp. JZ12]